MSSCFSGGSRTFGFDLEIVKSTYTSSRNSQSSSSPSSTLSESSHSPNALSTRKPRTPRKRPNQTYNEAAVLLSSAYPTIFPKNLTKPCSTIHNTNATSPRGGSVFFDESSELLLPCRAIDHLGFPLHRPVPSYNRIEQDSKSIKHSPASATTHEINPGGDEFETSSIMDEELEVEGIDSIMGVASPESEPAVGSIHVERSTGIAYSLGFTGLMMRRGVTALRQVDKGDWWRFPVIDMCQLSPRLSSNDDSGGRSQHKVASTDQKKLQKKKKKKVIGEQESEPNNSSDTFMEDAHSEPAVPNLTSSLILKLNYEDVLNAWSDRGSPYDEAPEPDMSRPNAHAMMLAQIDLFGDGGGVREASVLRYKEKRRTRLFSKKIRYQVRKVNADCRPRMKV
uniref:CCT domain-containing protein n=1 Tax=Kalanchoe fedtschenkoi TaxID=63787 RepID=A0A7N0VIU5_KALFE